ncbi:pyridoxamine 5'-phosphate oxidase family protein [Streptomyces sp. NPDC050211]|uniref:pyridoxamine 5'-phosphate oxidase family protein n=1 Tax=Streptomyces sp. NPDC050211 TaxID=3154932 RepID=UPI00341DADF8
MRLLSEQEIAYLHGHRIGRLATVGTSANPHVVPVGYHLDTDRGTIKIGATMLADRGQERLYVRHLRANPQVAFVVDDLKVEPSWTPSGILLKGTARLHTEGGEVLGPGFGPNWMDIVPNWVSSWGVDTATTYLPVPREE